MAPHWQDGCDLDMPGAYEDLLSRSADEAPNPLYTAGDLSSLSAADADVSLLRPTCGLLDLCAGHSISRRTHYTRRAKHLNRPTHCPNLSKEMEQAVADARREMPRLVEDGVAGAQALSTGFMQWGQGLLGAAARALGDVDAAAPRQTSATRGFKSGSDLRTSLRSRGGVRVALKRPATEVAKAPTMAHHREEAVDPFLLGSISPLVTTFEEDAPAQSSCRTPAVASDMPMNVEEPALCPSEEELEYGADLGTSWTPLADTTLDSSDDEALLPMASSSTSSSSSEMQEQDRPTPATSSTAVPDIADMSASWVAIPHQRMPVHGACEVWDAPPYDSLEPRLLVADTIDTVEDLRLLRRPTPCSGPTCDGSLAPVADAPEQPETTLVAEAAEVSRSAASEFDGEDEWTML